MGVVDWLFSPAGLTPHGFCLLWKPGLIWTHALADAAIGLAYFTIPLALVIVARRRRDLVFRPLFWLFATFILLCGSGHFLDLLTLWVPVYGIEGVVKAITAIVSLLTAVALWKLLPQALTLPSPAQFREANAALRHSQARYRAGFENSPIPLHTLNGEGIITSVSDSWLALLGYDRAAAVGKPIQQFQADAAPAWTAAERHRLQNSGESTDLPRCFRRADGTTIEALVSARLEHGAAELFVVCVVVDITARRRAEAALQDSEAKLRQAQKMEAVGQLTGGIAHDFNNLLTGISGSLELMQLRLNQRRFDELERYIGAADGAAKRAASLIHRLLAFSRRQTLDARPTEVNRLIEEMTDLIRRTVGPQIHLVTLTDPALWPTLCDRNQLESAVLNLCINARDAMPDGGSLTISTANATLDRDAATAREIQPGDYISICVSDTGQGMTEEVMRRAFDPFFTTKPIGAGTGLGLSMVYGFARQSGGQVFIYSELQKGTEMWLYLPRSRLEAMDEVLPLPGAPAVQAAGGTVLVVDDEPTVRLVVSEMLDGLGYTVIEAQDAQEGLAIVRSEVPIDLLVSDVGLPGGMNGRQFADLARALRPALKVLFITGYAETAIISGDTLPPGMQVVTKPFAAKTLATKIQSLVASP